MEPAKYKLFKQSITVDNNPWDINKAYDRLTIVTDTATDSNDVTLTKTYISRKDVSIGTQISNTDFWILINAFDATGVDAYETTIANITSRLTTLEDDTRDLKGDVRALSSAISFIGEIEPSLTLNKLNEAKDGLYVFVNVTTTNRSNRQAEDFEHYNQRGIDNGGTITDKGSYIIPSESRELFYYQNLRKDFDWTIETGDVLFKESNGRWNIIASEDNENKGGGGGESYPIIPIEPDLSNPGTFILEDDKSFEKGTETVYVNGVRYFHETGGYEYVSEGEEDLSATGITFNSNLNIDNTDDVMVSAKIIN